MSKLWLLVSVVLTLRTIRACDGNHEDNLVRQQDDSIDYYLANAYGFATNPWNAFYNYYQPAREQGKKQASLIIY